MSLGWLVGLRRPEATRMLPETAPTRFKLTVFSCIGSPAHLQALASQTQPLPSNCPAPERSTRKASRASQSIVSDDALRATRNTHCTIAPAVMRCHAPCELLPEAMVWAVAIEHDDAKTEVARE